MDLCSLLPAKFRRRRPRVALLRLDGTIGMARPGARALSDAALAPRIERAFKKGAFGAAAAIGGINRGLLAFGNTGQHLGCLGHPAFTDQFQHAGFHKPVGTDAVDEADESIELVLV